jgi:hypothetical protein
LRKSDLPEPMFPSTSTVNGRTSRPTALFIFSPLVV